MNWQSNIEVLTPLFNRGAYQDTPEIRVPSIRGMVRWWFRALGGTSDEEKEAFGGMTRFGQQLKGQVNASRLVFRVSQIRAARPSSVPTLPHKKGGQASPQFAFPAGAKFQLEVVNRYVPLSASLVKKVENALAVWLLLGALGLRANRAGGNVWPAGGTAPKTPEEFRARLDALGCRWPVMIAGVEAGTTMEQLRTAATDTVDGSPSIFGKARGGRQASRLKFKIARFGDQHRLLAFAPEMQTLEEARRLLNGHRSRPETWRLI